MTTSDGLIAKVSILKEPIYHIPSLSRGDFYFCINSGRSAVCQFQKPKECKKCGAVAPIFDILLPKPCKQGFAMTNPLFLCLF
jgi:hypothetical protein